MTSSTAHPGDLGAAPDAHAATVAVEPHEHEGPPIGLYLKVWGLLFVLSTFSYLVDYFHVQGLLRWTLIIVFMLAKAGLIVAVFMHMAWERLALICAILLPPMCLLVLVALMWAEADWVHYTRLLFFR